MTSALRTFETRTHNSPAIQNARGIGKDPQGAKKGEQAAATAVGVEDRVLRFNLNVMDYNRDASRVSIISFVGLDQRGSAGWFDLLLTPITSPIVENNSPDEARPATRVSGMIPGGRAGGPIENTTGKTRRVKEDVMPERRRENGRGSRRPPKGGQGGGPRGESPPRKTGGVKLRRVGGNDFELVHPRCVEELEPDYEEGIELWRAGEPEEARDALRYALQGCGDNIWVHVALGRIALEASNDPTLARGHFGYGFELVMKALPPNFQGRLPRGRAANRPFFDAVDGLIACHQALGQHKEADDLSRRAAQWAAGS